MPPFGFEPTIPVFKWAKTVHALDRAATVIGTLLSSWINYRKQFNCICLLWKTWILHGSKLMKVLYTEFKFI
jgi:hypothetical protein